MFRITTITILVAASVGLAGAGEIQVGGTNGLTAAYIASGCSGSGPCVSGSTGTTSEGNYDNVLFAGAQESGVSPTPYTGYSTSTANTGTLTDATDGQTFSMINDGTTGGASNNVWIGTQTSPATNPTITIPIGVFGVTEVWTLLDAELATAGAKSEIIFNFGTTSNAATVDSVALKLTDSAASGTPSGEIADAVDCSPASSCTLASGPTLASTSITATSGSTGAVAVTTGNVYSSAYNNGPLGAYSTAGGTLVLDDQGFNFNNLALTGALAGLTNADSYLVSIEVVNGAGGSGTGLGLSAVTLDTVVPEPSTVLLVLSGLGVIGFSRFRRRKVS